MEGGEWKKVHTWLDERAGLVPWPFPSEGVKRGVPGLSTIMLLYLWGSCIAYLVIIGDSFRPLLELAVGAAPPLPPPSLPSTPRPPRRCTLKCLPKAALLHMGRV